MVICSVSIFATEGMSFIQLLYLQKKTIVNVVEQICYKDGQWWLF